MFNTYRDIHCSLDRRSSTDPVTNWTLISGLDWDRDRTSMIEASKYPLEHLPAFLHELVHHWCFFSPVGFTLSNLQLRARRRAALMQERSQLDNEASWDVAEDVVRYETAIGLMRPLAEGMALFAEFDAKPGNSAVSSFPMQWVVLGFGRHLPFRLDNVNQIRPMLDAYRLHNHNFGRVTRDRKANVLVHPLTTHDGGYLAGYLTVKNLWNTLVFHKNVSKLADADLFLTFLQHYFYNDLGFVATLLDPSTQFDASRDSSAQAVGNYFLNRFIRLLEVTSDAEIDRLEQAILTDSPIYESFEELEQIPHIGTDATLAAVGIDRLKALLEEVNSYEGGDLEQMLRDARRRVLAQRDLMCIARFTGPVRVSDDGEVLFGQQTDDDQHHIYSMHALENVEQGEGEGSLEFYILPRRWLRVAAICRDDDLVAMQILQGSPDEDTKRRFQSYQMGFSGASEDENVLRAALEYALDEPVSAEYLNYWRNETRKVADDFFGRRALFFVPEGQVKQCSDAMQDNGFYTVLGEDYQLIRALARISLACSAEVTSKEDISRMISSDGLEAETIFSSLNRYSEIYGLPLLTEQGGRVFSWV